MDALEAMFSKVNSAVAIEKEVAADTVGELFVATKAAFAPYIHDSIPVLVEMLDHYYEGIRKSAIGALFAFIKTTYELSDPEDWVPGGVVVSFPLSPLLKLYPETADNRAEGPATQRRQEHCRHDPAFHLRLLEGRGRQVSVDPLRHRSIGTSPLLYNPYPISLRRMIQLLSSLRAHEKRAP